MSSKVKIVSERRDECGCVCYVKLVLVWWSLGSCMVHVGGCEREGLSDVGHGCVSCRCDECERVRIVSIKCGLSVNE